MSDDENLSGHRMQWWKKTISWKTCLRVTFNSLCLPPDDRGNWILVKTLFENQSKWIYNLIWSNWFDSRTVCIVFETKVRPLTTTYANNIRDGMYMRHTDGCYCFLGIPVMYHHSMKMDCLASNSMMRGFRNAYGLKLSICIRD